MKNKKGSLQQKNGRLYWVTSISYLDKTKQKWFALNLPASATKSQINKKVERLCKTIEFEQNNTFEESLLIKKCQNSPIDFLIDKFLEHKKSNVQPVTYDDYCYDLEFIKKYFSSFKLNFKDYKICHIEDFLTYLSNKNLSPTTITRYMNLLGAVFNYAIFLGATKNNIVKQVEKPKIKKKEHNYYTAKQIKYLCKKMEEQNSVYSLPIIIAATYGLRQSEVVGLLWSSVDFEQDKIYINNKVIYSQRATPNRHIAQML